MVFCSAFSAVAILVHMHNFQIFLNICCVACCWSWHTSFIFPVLNFFSDWEEKNSSTGLTWSVQMSRALMKLWFTNRNMKVAGLGLLCSCMASKKDQYTFRKKFTELKKIICEPKNKIEDLDLKKVLTAAHQYIRQTKKSKTELN